METNNNPNWLITKDIAKKLKKIGYNEANYFELNEESKVVIEIDTMEDSSIIDVTDLIVYKNEYWHNASVPTWTEVLEWFRKKGYHSTLHTYSVMQDNIEQFRFYYEINSRHDYIADPEEYYETYEDAREEMVEKLIEIYTNEK